MNIQKLTLKLFMTGAMLLSFITPEMGLAQSAQEAGRMPISRTSETQNKELIVNFYSHFFNNHELNAATQFIREDYIQHNPTIATGRQAFTSVFQGLFQQAPQFHTEIVRLLAAGDLVWVQSHQRNTPSALGLEIIDIYRIQDGRIAEHWDSIVPVAASPANSNTQF